MTSKNLVRRMERLEDSLLPVNEEPLVLVIIGVGPDGQKSEAFRFTVPNDPRLATKTRP